jgi:hypothetical protein
MGLVKSNRARSRQHGPRVSPPVTNARKSHPNPADPFSNPVADAGARAVRRGNGAASDILNQRSREGNRELVRCLFCA